MGRVGSVLFRLLSYSAFTSIWNTHFQLLIIFCKFGLGRQEFITPVSNFCSIWIQSFQSFLTMKFKKCFWTIKKKSLLSLSEQFWWLCFESWYLVGEWMVLSEEASCGVWNRFVLAVHRIWKYSECSEGGKGWLAVLPGSMEMPGQTGAKREVCSCK